jgi:D-xylose 1-dehydrogenase (NADP+, D-xylono-1,5-lactone-forming)
VKTLHVWRGDKHEAITIPAVDHYMLMVEDFADALINKRPPMFPPQDAVAQMRVLDRLYESAGKK